jgi:hypothetical protein
VPVLALISSFSNSARPPKTASINLGAAPRGICPSVGGSSNVLVAERRLRPFADLNLRVVNCQHLG